jgi:hypothetical protein
MMIEWTVVWGVGVESWMEVFVVEDLYKIVVGLMGCSTELVVVLGAMSVHLEYSLTQMKNPRWTWTTTVVVAGAAFQQGVEEMWAPPKAVSGFLLVQLMPPSQ